MMNKPPDTIIQDHIISSVAVVKHLSGHDLTPHNLNFLPKRLKDKYFVPSPIDMIKRTAVQQVYILTSDNLMLLKNNVSLTLCNAEVILMSLSDQKMSTVCVDDLVHSDNTYRAKVLSYIFVGPDFLDTTTIHAYKLPDVGVSIFVSPLSYPKIQTYHPVSVSLIDPIFHPRLINQANIALLENAVGKRGSYPSRSITHSQGSTSYFGKRGPGLRSGLSPTEGPGMSTRYHYNRQNNDARYLPGLNHSVNDLASCAVKHSMKMFKDSRVFPSSKSNSLEICNLAICTRLYSITYHIDKGDMLTDTIKHIAWSSGEVC